MVEEKKELNIEEVKKKLEECEKAKSEYLAGWQRARADFLNYKKDEMERIGGLVGYAQSETLLKILPILDDFEKAAHQDFVPQNLSGQERERIDKIIQGFLQIKKQIQDFLKSYGIEEIKTVGQKFDPNFAEVVEEVETKDNGSTGSPQEKSGIIVEEIQKGYTLQGKVIRAARVKVAK